MRISVWQNYLVNFTKYTVDGFSLDTHTQLFMMCHELAAKGVRWVMSNAHVPLVTEAFADHEIAVVSCKRAIHSKNPGAKANEVIVKG